jgi:hypothetical protein
MGEGGGSRENGIKSQAAMPPWGRRVPLRRGRRFMPDRPAMGGAEARKAWRGAKILIQAHGAVARVPADVRNERRCTGANRHDAGARSWEIVGLLFWFGLVGTTSSNRRPLDRKGS